MSKESITLSMELAKTQCYEFECFEDNCSLTISTQGCRINTRKFNTNAQSCPETSASFHNYFSYSELPWVPVAQSANPLT